MQDDKILHFLFFLAIGKICAIIELKTYTERMIPMGENKGKLSKKENIIQILKFVFFSVSAGLIETVVFTLLTELPPKLFDKELSYWTCYLPALVMSVLWNFTLNRKFTFKSAANVPIAMLKVAAYYSVFTPLSTYLGNIAAEHFHADESAVADYLILAATMAVNLITEYLYQRFVVFRNSADSDKEKQDT